MNKTTELASKVIAAFKAGVNAEASTTIAIPEDAILMDVALRIISREIADGYLRNKSMEVEQAHFDEHFGNAAQYIKYSECPVAPDDIKCESLAGVDYAKGMYTVEECFEAILEDAYRMWINEHADTNDAYESIRSNY